MYLTLNQAAKETGKSKATISRYIKNGRLSVKEKTENGYQLDPAEVFRVFPKENTKTGNMEQTVTPNETGGTHDSKTVFEIENEFLKKTIAMLEENIRKGEERESDLSSKLDKAQDTIESQTRLISDMRPEQPQKPTQGNKRFLWWKRT